MTNNIIIEGIKDATTFINNDPVSLMDHATNQLYYLDEILKKMNCEFTVLVNETYSNILMLEFETNLISKAIKYNKPAIKISEEEIEIIKTNCDDILKKTKQIRNLQDSRMPKLSQQDFQRVFNNESDIDFGAC